MEELKESTGKEIYAPVGKGIFVKAKIFSEDLNVDVGNGNFVKKSIPETKELIEEQIKKLEQVKTEMENNLEELGKEVMNMMGQEEGHVHDENCRHEEEN